MQGITLEIVDGTAGYHEELDDRLITYNQEHAAWDRDRLQVIARDAGGALVGGIHGVLRLGAVEVHGVWLDQHLRSGGVGTAMMRALEKEAKARGAKKSLLDTYSFQALGFYEKLGYTVFGTFNYPDGTARHYMQRTL